MSSTNHTQHYGLSQWEPEDAFLREDFNEDHRKIEEALAGKPELVFGSYVGTGTYPHQIDLGFCPQAVILDSRSGVRSVSPSHGGFFFRKHSMMNGNDVQAEIVEDGFIIRGRNLNSQGEVYYYMAVK